MPRSVLVTGGLGAVGSFVTKALLDAGADVTTFSRSGDLTTLRLLASDTDLARVDVRHADLRSAGELERAVTDSRPDVIIHLSSYLHADCEANPAEGYEVNVGGAAQALEAAVRHGVGRVVVASAKAAYGAVAPQHGPPQFEPVRESMRWEPANIYGLTKRAIEELCGYYRRHKGIEVACLRLGSTYGPGKKTATHSGYASLKTSIVEAAAEGRDILVRGRDLVDDVVYNRDVAKAFVCAATSEATTWSGHVYNVSGGVLVSISEFAAEVQRCCPDISVEFVEDDRPAASGQRIHMDISAAERDLGFVPDWPGTRGVSDYLSVASRRAPTENAGADRLELVI